MSDSPAYQEPWLAIDVYADNIAMEARRELAPGHPLFGLELTPLAQHRFTDDVLFKVDHPDMRFVVIHLTWSGHQEADSAFPEIEIYGSFEEWIVQRMAPDAENDEDRLDDD